MSGRKSISFLTGLLVAAFLAAPAGAAESVAGSWTAGSAEAPDRVQLSFVYGHSSNSSDNWRLSSLTGLDLAPAARHDVHFTVARDAGRIEAEGSASAGTAAGGFQFAPDPAYPVQLRKLGLGEIKPEMQFAFALHDVSLAFARDMMALKLEGLTADKLLAMRIHGVDAAYVKDLRAAGAHAAEADQLIAFRIHSVSPALVASFHGAGVTPDDSQLVALAIHGATPDFVDAVVKQGYQHPTADEVIALKIHGVTPDYIASVKSKGVRDVSLEQIVAMKIHGID